MEVNALKNEKIASIDYGKRRIGVASCDILHITATPRFTVDTNKEDPFHKIVEFLNKENIHYVVIGIPERDDDRNDDYIAEIRQYGEQLKKLTNVEIYEYDESYSTIDAIGLMINMGFKKKKRADKATKDMMAAAQILKNFINMIEK
jgi:putative holliday junction resolvase